MVSISIMQGSGDSTQRISRVSSSCSSVLVNLDRPLPQGGSPTVYADCASNSMLPAVGGQLVRWVLS